MLWTPVWVAPAQLPTPATSSSPVRAFRKPRRSYGAGAWLGAGLAVTARVVRRASDTDAASNQRLVDNLQRQVARLEEENRQLQAEVLAAKSSFPAEDVEQSAASVSLPGRFAFPKADLPFPLQSLRLVPPEQGLEYREEEGDWISLFRNAAPYIAAFRGGTVVVHLPSFMLEDDMQETFRGLMEDVAFCSLLGLQMVLVTSIECRLWQRLRPDEAFPSSDGSGTKASSQCWALRLMSILLGDVCRRTHPAVSAQEQAAAMLFEPGVRTAWCMQFMRMQAGQGQPETAIDSETESAVQSIKSFLKA
ncbi:SHM4 [Symbiodinium natans]|uniref:SHM4 protein n=1 Tax=Symbiodinium natans TaxID=878477 RepID=A0A812TK34_9DINO|nr:SHM4 [Symbiodinium natans]